MAEITTIVLGTPGPSGAGVSAAQWAALQAMVASATTGTITIAKDAVSALLVEQADGDNIFNVNTTGLIVSAQSGASLAVFSDNGTSEKYRIRGSNGHILTSGTSPSIAVAAGAGSGATASVNGTDTAGQINLNCGTSTATGAQFTVTFASAYASANYSVLLTAAESDAAATGTGRVFVNNASSSTASFRVDATGTALTASTSYSWYFNILEYEP